MHNLETEVIVELLREGMEQGQLPLLTITSGSMAPLLRYGDQVGIVPSSVEQLEVGDIVVFHSSPSLMTHRYWGTLESAGQIKCVTRGDGGLLFDPPWEAGRLVGRVANYHRRDSTFSLDSGRGRWLNRHLATCAFLESRLFAGFTANPLHPAAPATRLGTAYRRNPRHLGARLIRKVFQLWMAFISYLAWLLAAGAALRQPGRSLYLLVGSLLNLRNATSNNEL